MAPFKANNKMSASEIFAERLNYSEFAFSEDGEVNMVPEWTKNFWSVENLFYGRIREKSGEISIIAPKPEFLLNCRNSSPNSPVKALDFIVDASKYLFSEYKKDLLQSRITTGSPYMSDLIIHSGYVDVLKEHKKVQVEINKLFIAYSRTNILKAEVDNILSFDEFVPFFMKFLEKFLKISPVTRSSYLISKKSTPMSSGFCLEVAPLKHSRDEEKSKFFLEDENFHMLRHLAAASGFAVDKNAPWRLVADISSAKIIEFAAKRVPGISTAGDILDYYFEDARDSGDELEEFKKMVSRTYSAFVLERPSVSKRVMGSNQEVYAQQSKRTKEGFDSINARFTNEFWYDKFVKVKNIEFDLGYGDLETKKLAKSAADLESSLDRARATGYLKKRMTPIVASEGSLVYKTSQSSNSGVPSKKASQSLARRQNKKVY